MNQILLLVFFLLPVVTFSQVRKNAILNQPKHIIANAGIDQTVDLGTSVQLGGSPAAQYGSPGYFYMWQPSAGLSNITIPNPVATPDQTTQYVLTVFDSRGCSGSDTVIVVVGTSGIADRQAENHAEAIYDKYNKTIYFSAIAKNVTGKLKVSLFNAIGQKVYSDFVGKTDGVFAKTISTSELSRGVFILKIEGAGLDMCKKISVF